VALGGLADGARPLPEVVALARREEPSGGRHVSFQQGGCLLKVCPPVDETDTNRKDSARA
jgi:hypothetical protein